jgi:hypothetical protein
VPALRTIQKYVGEYEAAVQGRPTDPARRDWTLADGDGDVLLPLLRYLKAIPLPIPRRGVPFTTWSKSARFPFGQVQLDIARHYVAILRAKPSIPILEAWSLAIDYWGNETVAGGTYELDEYLAFEPWVDNGEAYVTAIQEKRLLTEEPRETGSTSDAIQFLRQEVVERGLTSQEEAVPSATPKMTTAERVWAHARLLHPQAAVNDQTEAGSSDNH